MSEIKLLIHIASSSRWDIAAKNGVNFLRSGKKGDRLWVRLVANGDAVTRCIKCDRPLFDKLKQIVLDGGEIFLCENSLRDNEIKRERLPDIFNTVPAAIRVLAEWQQQGWAYVRP